MHWSDAFAAFEPPFGLSPAVGCVGLALACSTPTVRPPPPDDCVECRFTPDNRGTTGSQSGGAGTGDAGMLSAGTLTGNVRELFTDDLTTSRLLSVGALQIIAPGAEQDFVQTTYDGSAPYVLDGVLTDEPVWVRVAPGQGAVTVSTIQRVDASVGNVDLVAARADVLESLAVTAALNNPAELDPNLAHLVIFAVDEFGDPLPGVSAPVALGTTLAYDAGGTFSDQLLETDARGALLMLNVPAPVAPGADRVVTLARGSDTLSLTVRLARGSLTVATVSN